MWYGWKLQKSYLMRTWAFPCFCLAGGHVKVCQPWQQAQQQACSQGKLSGNKSWQRWGLFVEGHWFEHLGWGIGTQNTHAQINKCSHCVLSQATNRSGSPRPFRSQRRNLKWLQHQLKPQILKQIFKKEQYSLSYRSCIPIIVARGGSHSHRPFYGRPWKIWNDVRPCKSIIISAKVKGQSVV